MDSAHTPVLLIPPTVMPSVSVGFPLLAQILCRMQNKQRKKMVYIPYLKKVEEACRQKKLQAPGLFFQGLICMMAFKGNKGSTPPESKYLSQAISVMSSI